MPRYNPAEIEPKWQKYWEENSTFRCPEMPQGEKRYVLDMFPYPSGDGLHVGHPEGYTATDIVCRFERMRGKSVLHPMGFDAFGLPAEEHAIKTNTPPRVQTEKNIDTFRRQLKMLGFSYDWDRELATTDVDYFRWTQWIFVVLHDTWFDEGQQKGRPIAELPIPAEVQAEGEDAVRHYQDDHRLAYQSAALVNWCPALGTVLANEEVQDGLSERGGHPVERRPLKQWMLRITAYADRLEKDLDPLDWSEGIKSLQRNWIGRSEGAEVDFFIGDEGRGTRDEGSGIGGRGAEEDSRVATSARTLETTDFSSWKKRRAESGYPRKPEEDVLRVYTTRPDTLFGATYMVIAPEHPFVERLTTAEQAEAVQKYCQQAASKSDLERTEMAKTKTGVYTGSCAINPVNGESVPIWIADYVLISYGTGAIMAVPAHDTRDFEFAQQFEIPITAVVDPGDAEEVNRDAVLAGKEVFTELGTAVNSDKYDGLATPQFKKQISADLGQQGLGKAATAFKLRDWLFSRQRFWGEPFPILKELEHDGSETSVITEYDEESEEWEVVNDHFFDGQCATETGFVRAVDPVDLPVDLPHLDDYKPHGRPEPPLEKAPADWLYVEIDGKRYKRETNTMPQWAGSCWYYLRFIDPKNDQAFIDPEKEKAWMPIDLYVGGAEHAVLHLLYSRFWHKVLYDRGYVSTPEPFAKLVNQGMILGEVEFTGYKCSDGNPVSASGVKMNELGKPVMKQIGAEVTAEHVDPNQVEKQGDAFVLKAAPEIRVDSRAYKMSKSRGNVINPDEIVKDYGADSLRLYEMFMGPLEAMKPWNMAGVNGVRGFLDRTWRMIADHQAEELQLNDAVKDVPCNDEQNRVLHRTIMAVSHDVENMEFNTAIARMMEFVNFFTKQTVRPKSAMEQLVLMVSPYAPHIAEELWQLLGHDDTLAYEPWPQFDEALTKEDTIEIPVQFKGKVRAKINVPAEASREELEAAALADSKVKSLLEGKEIVKTIVVPGRMVNFVVK